MIKMEHIYKQIKGKTILEDINLSFEGGRIYGLRGINGSGKTMLMRMISGLIFPDRGSVSINEKQLGKDISFPEKIGILIENPAFLDSYTGSGNLELLAALEENTAEEDIRTALSRAGLDPDDKRKYRKYSLGMKQRLGIAAAIMGRPELLILDEPTNALDEYGIAAFRDILFEEKHRGASVIWTCHDDAKLLDWSDEVIRIENGRVSEVMECK